MLVTLPFAFRDFWFEPSRSFERADLNRFPAVCSISQVLNICILTLRLFFLEQDTASDRVAMLLYVL